MLYTASVEEMRQLLNDELQRRCRTNARYSLRAFARRLQVEPAALSKILRGTRRVTPRMREHLLANLGLKREALTSVTKNPSDFNPIQIDEFKVIADWYHFAILELIHVKGFVGDPGWVAASLKISIQECQDAIERLERLGYLQRNGQEWKDVAGNVTTTVSPYTTVALRAYQRQVLAQGIDALENTTFEEREQSAICLRMDSKLIPKVREEIRKFRRKLVEMTEAHGQANEVYQMSFSVFPISNARGEK